MTVKKIDVAAMLAQLQYLLACEERGENRTDCIYMSPEMLACICNENPANLTRSYNSGNGNMELFGYLVKTCAIDNIHIYSCYLGRSLGVVHLSYVEDEPQVVEVKDAEKSLDYPQIDTSKLPTFE